MKIEIDNDAEIVVNKLPFSPFYRVSIGRVHFILSAKHYSLFWDLESDFIDSKKVAINRFIEMAEKGVFNDPLNVAARDRAVAAKSGLSRLFHYIGLGTILLTLNSVCT